MARETFKNMVALLCWKIDSSKTKVYLLFSFIVLSLSLFYLTLLNASSLSATVLQVTTDQHKSYNELDANNIPYLFDYSNITRTINPIQLDDFDRKMSFPWRGDLSCQHFGVQLAAKDSLPKRALTSFPGSGVTWTRQLIEGATGIYTGSVYQMDPLPVKSLEMENANTDDPLCGCTIIDKDHEATISATANLSDYYELLHRWGHAGIVHAQYDSRGVLLLRNPLDVVFTFRHWQYGGKVGKAPAEAFTGPEWDETVNYVAYVWADHAVRWIEQIINGTVIFYEKLMGEEAENELVRLLNVIDFKSIDPDRMRCTLAHRNRTDFKRANPSRMILEPQHRMLLMKSVHRVQQSLRRKNWPRLPIYMYDMHSPDGRI